MNAIEDRENQLSYISTLNDGMNFVAEEEKGKSVVIKKIGDELIKLRQQSIRVVELIVLWRDQLRYLALLGAKQKQLRKRRAQNAIQVPYLTQDNINYLLKMKVDTIELSKLTLNQYFNFGEQRGDPFLIQLSVFGNVVAGNDIRAIKRGKEQQHKLVLPLGEDDVTKAKACEEMIMFERQPAPGQIAVSGPFTEAIDAFHQALRKLSEQSLFKKQPQTNATKQISSKRFTTQSQGDSSQQQLRNEVVLSEGRRSQNRLEIQKSLSEHGFNNSGEGTKRSSKNKILPLNFHTQSQEQVESEKQKYNNIKPQSNRSRVRSATHLAQEITSPASKSALSRASESKASFKLKPPSGAKKQALQETQSIAESIKPSDVRKSKNVVSPHKLKDQKAPQIKNFNVNAYSKKEVVVAKGNKDSSVSRHRSGQEQLDQKAKAVQDKKPPMQIKNGERNDNYVLPKDSSRAIKIKPMSSVHSPTLEQQKLQESKTKQLEKQPEIKLEAQEVKPELKTDQQELLVIQDEKQTESQVKQHELEINKPELKTQPKDEGKQLVTQQTKVDQKPVAALPSNLSQSSIQHQKPDSRAITNETEHDNLFQPAIQRQETELLAATNQTVPGNLFKASAIQQDKPFQPQATSETVQNQKTDLQEIQDDEYSSNFNTTRKQETQVAGSLKKMISTETSQDQKLEDTLNKQDFATMKTVKLNGKENKTDQIRIKENKAPKKTNDTKQVLSKGQATKHEENPDTQKNIKQSDFQSFSQHHIVVKQDSVTSQTSQQFAKADLAKTYEGKAEPKVQKEKAQKGLSKNTSSVSIQKTKSESAKAKFVTKQTIPANQIKRNDSNHRNDKALEETGNNETAFKKPEELMKKEDEANNEYQIQISLPDTSQQQSADFTPAFHMRKDDPSPAFKTEGSESRQQRQVQQEDGQEGSARNIKQKYTLQRQDTVFVSQTPEKSRIVSANRAEVEKTAQAIEIQDQARPPLELQALKISVEEFWSFANSYLPRLPANIRESQYEIDKLCETMENGYERHYMKIISFHNGVKMGHGLACFNVDYKVPLIHRVFIRHVSTIKNQQLDEALAIVINYIWRKIYCDNIRFELFHIKDAAGALKADLKFKESLAKAGFRWKNLCNDPTTGKRSQIMQLDKPKDRSLLPPFENDRQLQLGKEPLTASLSLILGLVDINDTSKHEPHFTEHQVEAPVCILACFQNYKEERLTQIEMPFNEANPEHKMDQYFRIADELKEIKMMATKSLINSAPNVLQDLLISQNLEVDLAKLHVNPNQVEYSAAVTSLVARLPPFDYLNQNGKAFLNIKSKDIVTAHYIKNQTCFDSIAIIPTDEERLKIILIPLTLVHLQLKLNRSMISIVQDVLSNIEVIEPDEPDQIQSLLLPSFNIESVFEVPELVGTKLCSQRKVAYAHMAVNLNLIKGRYQEEGLISSPPTYVMKGPFLFVVSDAESVDKTENLPLFVARIDKHLNY